MNKQSYLEELDKEIIKLQEMRVAYVKASPGYRKLLETVAKVRKKKIAQLEQTLEELTEAENQKRI